MLRSLVCLLVVAVSALCAPAADTYRAAVFQHFRIKVPGNATASRLANVASYSKAASAAKEAGAQIIVFPEIGLGSNEIDRALNIEFGEDVPDASDAINPCTAAGDYCTSRPALCRISCLARETSMYMVVGMNDLKNCTGQPNCTKDGVRVFNTGVVFDPTGLVIQRYHKEHIFSPIYIFDIPTPAQVRSFDTDFGVKFGIFICFDSLFPDPPLELVEQGLRHFVFPTSWENAIPFMTSLEFQQSWSRTFNSTMLASNTALKGTSGSGLYTCGTPVKTYFNATGSGVSDEKLLVADMPKQGCPPDAHVAFTPRVEPLLSKPASQSSQGCGVIGIDAPACDLVDVKPGQTYQLSAQYRDLHCTASLTISPSSADTGERYGLVVISKTVWLLESLPVQYCSIIRCANTDACVLDDITNASMYRADTLIESWSIQGNFSHVHEQPFPVLVTDGGELLPVSAMTQSYNGIASAGDAWPHTVLHAALFHRIWNSTSEDERVN